MSHLPVEVVEQILLGVVTDLIDSESKHDQSIQLQSLEATVKLLTVCHRVYHLLRPYVYRSVQLQTEEKARKFLSAIENNPKLCQFIVNLDLKVTRTVNLHGYPRGYLYSDAATRWVYSRKTEAPNFSTGTKIIVLLLGRSGDVAAVAASNLLSLIIHADYLAPSSEASRLLS
jgi:hypothetical protein